MQTGSKPNTPGPWLADFGGAVFTRVHFQKTARISSLCDFHYISEGIPLLMRF